MTDRGLLAIKPICFSDIMNIGCSGSDSMSVEYYTSKIIVQNVLYVAYHEPSTIEQIANKMDVPQSIIHEIIKFLENHSFVDEVSHKKYLTKMMIHDLPLEIIEERNRIFTKYSDVICQEYCNKCIQQIKTNILQSFDIIEKFYIPDNDTNFFLWTLLSLAFYMKFDMPELDTRIGKHFTKRKDGSEYISVATVDKNPHLYNNANNMNFNTNEKNFKNIGVINVKLRSNSIYPSFWQYNSFHDNRSFNGISSYPVLCRDLYMYLNNKLTQFKDYEMKIQKLYEHSFIDNLSIDLNIQYTKPFVNLILSSLSKEEIADMLPPIPSSFINLNEKLSTEIYNLCHPYYPKQMKDTCYDFYAKQITDSNFIFSVFDMMIKYDILKPLTNLQKKTVNMILFSDVLGVVPTK